MSNNSLGGPDELIAPEQINADFLYDLFRDAYLAVYRDDVGDIYIKDNFTLWVFPQPNGEQIRLMAQFEVNPEVPREIKLEYANEINDQLKFVRAYVDEANDLGFDYYIFAQGGTTKRNLVFAVRSFANYVQSAMTRDKSNIFG